MPSPGGILPFKISFQHKDNLAAAVDVLQPLMASRTLGNIPSLRRGLWDCAVYASKDELWPENGGRVVPEEVELRILKEMDIGFWVRCLLFSSPFLPRLPFPALFLPYLHPFFLTNALTPL